MKHEECQQQAKVHNERKAKHTVKLTKETRKPRTAKNAGSKCDLLGRLTNETDKQT